MADYAVGDLQGNIGALESLLARIRFKPGRDRVWFTGDLVNRGPGSLECLRLVRGLGDSALVVLGNHDLHLLCIAYGATMSRKGDTLDDILAAPDRQELLHWLRTRPLLVQESGHVMVHAGLLPQWTVEDATGCAAEVSARLSADDVAGFLSDLYGNKPDRWGPELAGMDRLRLIVNAMTRMRVCTADGTLNLRFKGEPRDSPSGTYPWFEVSGRKCVGVPVICGHWSALGLQLRDNLIALDTGCHWGRTLTAVRLHDRTVFQVPCFPTMDESREA